LDLICFRIILGIAHGVHYLHEQHVLHLDLKPANILLDSDMNPKITNFGIAKNIDEIDAHADNLEGTV
jgi:L1 cell adhesion molecule like protein